MDFKHFLAEQLLAEGGNALRGVLPITQDAIKHALPSLVDKVAEAVGVDSALVRVVGSAGKKPSDQLSGDVDLAVQAPVKSVERALSKLSSNHRAMPGVNAFSFSYDFGGQPGQVDLIPVDDVEYAVWSFGAHPDDLARGLKSAHRNEVLYAVAKYAGLKRIGAAVDGESPERIERYFYDTSRGLLRGTQVCVDKRGRPLKNYKTLEKSLVTADPKRITKILFGSGVNPEDVATYRGAMAAVNSSKFPHKSSRDEILAMIRDGIKKKGLTDPEK